MSIKYSKNNVVEILSHEYKHFNHFKLEKMISAMKEYNLINLKNEKLADGSIVSFTNKDLKNLRKVYEIHELLVETNSKKSINPSYRDAVKSIVQIEQ